MADTHASSCACAAIRQASRQVTQLYDQALAPFGLRLSQYQVLARLQRSGPRAMAAFAADLGMDRTTLARNLQPLERDGLLRLEPDPDDGRKRRLVVTAAGARRVERAREGWKQAQQRFEKAFGKERTGQLMQLLQSLSLTAANASDEVVS